MKEQILELRQAGKSYNEICQILGCAKSTVAYHCGNGQKDKVRARQKTRRKDLVILSKVENFQSSVTLKSNNFQRERIRKRGAKRKLIRSFNWKDVIEKFGWETTCYLTGRRIDLKDPRTYHFDHINSIAKGGTSVISNLGICCREANQAKHDMSVKELLALCKEILEHNGYKVQGT